MSVCSLSDCEDIERVRSILRQPFRYVGQGMQSAAFLSKDGQYILKFIKQNHWRPHCWRDVWPWLREVQTEVVRPRRKTAFVHNRWEFAYRKARLSGALLFMHLEPTSDSMGWTQLTDGNGQRHWVNMDRTAFLIQRCAVPLDHLLTALLRQGQIDQAAHLLGRLISRVQADAQRGICNHDLTLPNIGCVDGDIIYIDVGDMMNIGEDHRPDPLYRIAQWLERRGYPDLACSLYVRFKEFS